MTDHPDKFTNEWYSERFRELFREVRGMNHGINRCNAEYADSWEAIQELRRELESTRKELAECQARIGETRIELRAVTQKNEKMAEWIRTKWKENGK